MKIKITSIVVLLVLNFLVYATEYVYKPLVEPGKVWSEYHSYTHHNFSEPELTRYEKYYIQYILSDQDTIYNGQHYYKIYQIVNCEWNVPKEERLIGGLREEDRKVYLIGFPTGDKISRPEFFFDEPWEYSNQLGTEIVLYDFTLKKDDYFSWTADHGGWYVLGIDTVFAAGAERNRINLGSKVIEGIGCDGGLFSLFAPIPTCDDCDIKHYLLSVQLPDSNKYRISEVDYLQDCLMNGLGTKQVQSDRLSYTVVSDRESVTVNFTENIPERIELVNMNGTVLVGRETGGASHITLPITDYPSGSYLLLLRQGAETKVGKFVKP